MALWCNRQQVKEIVSTSLQYKYSIFTKCDSDDVKNSSFICCSIGLEENILFKEILFVGFHY